MLLTSYTRQMLKASRGEPESYNNAIIKIIIASTVIA